MAAISVNFMGRFGNQMFQYAAARAYAELHKASLHTHPWIGQEIFMLSDQPYRKLPIADFDALPIGRTDITLHGYFLHSGAAKILNAQKLRQWFRLQPRWVNLVNQVEIAAHLRYGDYIDLQGIYCLIKKESYVKACQKFGLDEKLITWVSEENTNNVKIGGKLSFLPDFLTLMTSKTLFRANSSFSWWAATLSNGTVYSPVVEARTGWSDVDFVPGNWPRIADSSRCNCRLDDLHVL